MIKFFRHVRQNLLAKGKTTQYFKYAIGEIILVVIGILIALQINNWNEARKENKYLNKVYEQIQKDLKSDTIITSQYIKIYKEKNKRLTDITERNIPSSYYDTINKANFAQCEKCISDITNAYLFENLDKGYQLLKSLNIEQNNHADSLSLKIDTFYKNYNEVFPEANKILVNLINEAIDNYQEYDWFVEWSVLERRTYNKEFVTYIFESDEYRIKSARHLMYTKYYLGKLTDYEKNASILLELLDKKLKE